MNGSNEHGTEVKDCLRYIKLRQQPQLENAAAEWFHSKWRVPMAAYLQ